MNGDYREPIVRVLVSAHSRMPAECLVAALCGFEGIEVVASAYSEEDACRYVSGHKPDVVLMLAQPSIPLTETAISRAVVCLSEHSPTSRLVMLSYGGDAEAARITLKAGARAFVTVDESVEVLAEAIIAAAAGETYVNPRLLTDMAMLGDGFADGLTHREREVLRLLALGYSNAEAASHPFLSIRTIESYRASLYEKLGIASRREVVRYAIRKQLVP